MFMFAQEPSPPVPTPSGITLLEGTPVLLQFAQGIKCRVAKKGDIIELTVSDAVQVNGVELLSPGMRAVAVLATPTGADPKADTPLLVQPVKLRVGERVVPLRGIPIPACANKLAHTEIRTHLALEAYVSADTVVDATGLTTHSSSELAANNLMSLQQETVAATPADKVRLTNGTVVNLRVIEALSSKIAKPGDEVKFEVIDEVKVDNLVVIAASARASGSVVTVQGARRAWRAGNLAIQLNWVQLVNDQQQPLAISAIQRKGAPVGEQAILAWMDALRWTAGGAFFFLPLAPLQHGKQAMLPSGTTLSAVTLGEVLLDRASIEARQPNVTDAPPSK